MWHDSNQMRFCLAMSISWKCDVRYVQRLNWLKPYENDMTQALMSTTIWQCKWMLDNRDGIYVVYTKTAPCTHENLSPAISTSPWIQRLQMMKPNKQSRLNIHWCIPSFDHTEQQWLVIHSLQAIGKNFDNIVQICSNYWMTISSRLTTVETRTTNVVPKNQLQSYIDYLRPGFRCIFGECEQAPTNKKPNTT